MEIGEESSRLEVRQKFALPLIKGGRVLDVGCSDGRLLKKLKSSGMEVQGIEINPALARKCAEEGLNVMQGDIEVLDTGTLGLFDTIVMTDVIEHLSDPLNVLKRLKNNLNPAGRVVLTTPNVNWFFWHFWSLLGQTPHAWINPEHKQFYNPKTFYELLEKAGYKVVGENSIGKIPRTNVYFKSPNPILSCNIVVSATAWKT